MARRERNPVEEVVNEWNKTTMSTHREHVIRVWPDLAKALAALSHAVEHAPLSPASVRVPVSPARSPSAPRERPSAPRGDVGRTGSSSAQIRPVQPPLLDIPEDAE